MNYLLNLLNIYEFSLFEYFIIAVYIALGIFFIARFFARLGGIGTTRTRLNTNNPDVVAKYYKILKDEPNLRLLRFRFVFIKIMGISFLIISLFFLTNELGTLRFFMFIIGFISLIFKFDKEYVQTYKYRIITAALKEYDSSLSYFPDKGLSESIYLRGYSEVFSTYASEDYISGYVNGFNFSMSDVTTKDKYETRYGPHYVIDFQGPVAVLDLKEYVDFELQLSRNDETDLFVVKEENAFVVDNPEFDSRYKVETDNPLKATMILTPSLTNKLLDLYKSYGVGFDLRIVKNSIFIKLKIKDLFKPHILNRTAEAYGIAMYFEILDSVKIIFTEMSNVIDKLEK